MFQPLVKRYGIAGAVLGLAAGLYEAAQLYFISRRLAILDVGEVIWLVAPFVGLLIFGVSGLVSGWVASKVFRRDPWGAAILAACGFGTVGAYVFLVRQSSRASLRGMPFLEVSTPPILVFVCVSALALLVFRVGWRVLSSWFDAGTRWPVSWPLRVLTAAVFLVVCGHLVLLFLKPAQGSSRASASGSSSRPNLVLITLDTVRADHLSAYGYARTTTPNLDRAARQGVLFENAIATSSWTLPSHASMFTGLLPHQHGANYNAPLPPGSMTLAGVLGSRGYETAAFAANTAWFKQGRGMDQGFDVYDDDTDSVRHNLRRTLSGRAFQELYYRLRGIGDFGRKDARQLNHEIFDWLRHRSKSPFFLFVNYYDAHDPYVAPPPYDKSFGSASASLLRRARSVSHGQQVSQRLSAEDTASLISAYDNCLAFLDSQVGELLAFLASSPNGSNTIVVITSDHGEAFGEHDCYGHGCGLHRELLHVPLIVFGPGIPSGRRVSPLVSIRGIFSTVLDAASGDIHLPLGASLRRFWTAGANPQLGDQVAVSELTPAAGVITAPTPSISLMTGEWHYLRDATGRSRLYRWREDGGEETDLSSSAEGLRVSQQLEQRLYGLVRYSRPPWHGGDYLLAFGAADYTALGLTARVSKEPGSGRPQIQPEAVDEIRSVPYE